MRKKLKSEIIIEELVEESQSLDQSQLKFLRKKPWS